MDIYGNVSKLLRNPTEMIKFINIQDWGIVDPFTMPFMQQKDNPQINPRIQKKYGFSNFSLHIAQIYACFILQLAYRRPDNNAEQLLILATELRAHLMNPQQPTRYNPFLRKWIAGKDPPDSVFLEGFKRQVPSKYPYYDIPSHRKTARNTNYLFITN